MPLNLENIDLGGFGIAEETDQVRANVDQALTIDPDQHAKITDLSKRSGVPEFAVEDNPAKVEHNLNLENIDFAGMSKRSPGTSQYLTDFNNAAIAHDDIDVMESIEGALRTTGDYIADVGAGFEKGQLTVESSEIGLQGMYSALGSGEILTDEQIARLQEIESITKHGVDDYGFLAGAPITAAEQLPIMYEILRTGLGYAAAGAAVTGGTVAAVTAVTGPGAIPAGIAAAVPGAKFGGRVGVAKAAFDLEAGLAFNEFAALRDENDQIMNPQVAAGAAAFVGSINAGLEFISLAALGRTVTPAMRLIVKTKVKTALATETGREMMTRLLKDYGLAVGTETITESAQEFTNVIGAELAKSIDKDSFTEQDLSSALDNIFSGETAERVVEAGRAGAQASLVFGGVGTTASVIVEQRQREKLSKDEQLQIDTLNANVGESKLKERDKESFRQFVGEADGDNNTQVFIDGAQTSLYLQGKTPEEIEADPALKMLAEKAAEAAALGGDIQMPVADFATDIAGTDHFDALRDSMTMSPESMSPFRQEQVTQETENYVKVLMEEAQQNTSEYVEAQAIYESVKDQLIDTGQVLPANASVMAQLVPAWATAQARRSGKTVTQVYQESGLTVEGPQTGEAARLAGEGVLEQAKASGFEGDIVSEAQEFQGAVDKGLDMSTEARTQRAQEMGFDTEQVLYHGSREGLKGDTRAPFWLTSSKEQAERYARGGEVVEMYTSATPTEVTSVDVINANFGENESISATIETPAIGRMKAESAQWVVVKDPSQIRSIHAAFDPEFKESAQLLAQRTDGKPEARGYYDPANSVIRLTEAADLSTFLHEFAHFMYEMELGGNTDMVQSINNWYKRNAEAVAKEANSYLGEAFDTLKQGGVETIDDRKQRAKEQGFDVEQVWYHGTTAEFGEFQRSDLGVHLGTTEQASNRLADVEATRTGGSKFTGRSTGRVSEGANIIPVYTNVSNSLRMIDVGIWNNSVAVLMALPDELKDDSLFDEAEELSTSYEDSQDWVESRDNTEILDEIRGKIAAAGYDSVVYINQVENQFGSDAGLTDETKQQIAQLNSNKQAVLATISSRLSLPENATEEDVQIFLDTPKPQPTAEEQAQIDEINQEIQELTERGTRSNESLIILDPSQIRSVSAQFQDPESAQLLAQPTDGAPTPKEGSITEENVIQFLDQTTTGDKGKDAAIRRAVHEQFARGFETYLMEGKAPSIELRNAFRTFARWLSRVYQAIRGNLRVDLDDEMRKVFDRLLATEEQIAAAESRARVEPMFTDAAMAGMTEEEFTAYQKQQEKAKDVQSETLRDKLIQQLTRQTERWWKEEKQDIIDEQIDTLKAERVYAAREQLRAGVLKLDHAAVKDMIGEDKVDKLGRKSRIIPPALSGTTAKGQAGIHPDEAAAFLGYTSGPHLLADLSDAPSLKDKAEANAEAAMLERHGDILNDGTIEREADEAVQNEERGKLILQELKALAKGTNIPTIDRMTIKDLATRNIGKLSFREIHPGKYRKAEIRAAQEATQMLAAGNRDGAATAKMRQVMNFYLGMAATEAKNETTKIVDRMNRYNKKRVREEIQKAGNDYWEQIVNILNRFEFRKSATLKEVESINLWAKERMESDGDGLVLSNAVLNEAYTTHWKNVPFSDLQGINDSVKNIEHVARYANKIKLQQEEIDFKKLKGLWVSSIEEQDARFSTKESRSRIDDSREATTMEHVRKWASQLTKVPFLASWLDGGERTGLSQDILVQQFTDALDDKIRMVDDIATPVLKAIDNRSKADQKRHNTKVWIPEINDYLMGHQVLAVALNTGNQGNLKKLLLGEGWADPEVEADISLDNRQLQAVLAHMTQTDWELVQLIWDQMEKLYPKLAEVHRRTTGLVPPKVDATPVVTPFGEFRGGYYPVKYSPKRSHKAEKNAEKRAAETDSMFNNTASIQASVNASATNERTGFYDRIYLSLEVVPDHFNETIHYITHHDAVRQVNRMIQAPDVANAITAVLGEEEFKQLKPWLNDIAKDGRQQPTKTYIDTMFNRLRFGTTLGVMGFKASTGIMQVFGLLTTAAELGVGPTVQGIYTAVGRAWYMKAVRKLLGSRDDMQTGWEFAVERSKVMSHRALTMDREIKNAMDRLRGKTGLIAAVQEASMKHIALIQTYMVDLPTWHAAYMKEVSESGDEARAIKRADWSVENLQGSGATKDMATILRNQSKIHTTFTMFMTFFSSLGNLSRDLVKGGKTGIYSPTSVAAKLMFLFTLPVFLEMLMRGDLEEPDDEDDRLSKFATGVALYPLQGVPFVRDVAGGLIGDYGYNSSPVASLLEKGIQGSKQIGERAFTDEEVTEAAAKNTSKIVAAAAGIPGINQLWATSEHLYDVIENGEDLTARELLFGPDRK